MIRRASFVLIMCLTLTALLMVANPDLRAADKDPHAALLDKAAPDISGDFALNGKPVKMADLKGKVVLLDFWAVWCPPCIKTIPHLKDWHTANKEKGLVVIGLTSYYEQIGFDKESGKPMRLQTKLNKEQEQAMLKDFAAHHKMEYLIQTAPQADMEKISEAYKVEGIPQAVLIDRKGNVRMVKVGATEENAKALEEMIKKLIEEK
jgi:thiol-disulfide isomerase/thioredoxin